jgi:outer membrane protein OmpA-like peptidoglycan-associated protein
MDSMAELAFKERKKVVESILRLREQQKNVEKELKAELAHRDSAAKTKTGLVAGNAAKPAQDSLYHQRLAEKYKVIQDSMNGANARIEIIAQQIDAKKMLDDSLQKLKAEEKNMADNSDDLYTPKVYPTAKATETPFSDLPAVFFSKNSDTLDESQQINLDGIIKMLSGDNKSQLYLFAIASADENSPKELAIKRNETLTRYLKNSGITTDRIKTAHPGNKVSRNGCMDINCPEDMLKQNRCVVFQITKE